MTTAQQIIDRSLSLIGVKTAGVTLSDDEYTDGIDTLNDMMAALDASGLHMSYSVVTNKEDDIGSPSWTWGYIKAALAIELATEYQKQISASLGARFRKAEQLLLQKLVDVGESYFPSTLPRGTSCNDTYYNSRYFSGPPENDILAEDGNGLQTDRNQQITSE